MKIQEYHQALEQLRQRIDDQPAPAGNDRRSWEQKRDDVIVVTIWLLMLSYALASNILILVGIAKNVSMRSATSYWFITSLAVCDIIMVVISLAHLVPATAFHSAFLDFHSVRNIVMIFIYDLFWYTAVLQLGLMACNRLVSIVYPMEYKWLFSQRNALISIISGYALGFTVSLPTLFPCCHTLWNSDYYITVYDPMDTWYKYIDMSVNSFSLFIMIVSYAIIIYKVRESSQAMAKYQLTIKMEFFVVSLVFLLTWTTWQWLPHMSNSKWAYFVMTSLFFINNSVNPTVYLLFNTQLRRELTLLLWNRHVKPTPGRRCRALSTKRICKCNESTGSNSQLQLQHQLNHQNPDDQLELELDAPSEQLIKVDELLASRSTEMNIANSSSTSGGGYSGGADRAYRRLLVNNGMVIIIRDDACDV